MNLHEYQSKEVFREFGIPVPAGKAARSADGVSCSFSVAQGASPAARCAAIKRQCGGKFYANYCGDKLLSAM